MKGIKNESIHTAYPQDRQCFFVVKACELRTIMRLVMKTYKYKLYNNKKNKYLVQQIEIASEIWNFCIAMRRMYYLVYGKTLKANDLKKYITKICKRRKWGHWHNLGSQAIQDVVERVDRAYKAYFDNKKKAHPTKKSLPKFKKREMYKSFTLKQAGYKFDGKGGVIINGKKYRYFDSRPLKGKVKTLTVKRDNLGDVYLFVVTQEGCNEILPRAGKAVGMDFGLKHFLNLDDGSVIDSPEWYKASLKELQRIQRHISRCKPGSNNRKKAIKELNRIYRKICNQRTDWFFKAAYQLIADYAIICIENLNLAGMQKLWGRKINDIAFGEFVKILEWTASNCGTEVVKIDRFAPSGSGIAHLAARSTKETSMQLSIYAVWD